MKLKTLDYLNPILVMVVIVLAIYFYPLLPAKVASHWNFAGEVDGWSSKNFQVIFLPLLTLAVYLLFQFLPRLDPKKMNYAQFGSAYKIMQFVFLLFFAILFVVTSLANLGWNLPIGTVVSSLIGVMFIIFGFLMPKFKSNWFIGIRTPWTLSSDSVWQKTHELAKYMFIIAGAMFIFISYLPEGLMSPAFVLLIVLLLIPVIYSYFLFKKERK
ncbi:SdpI family protein [Candidatus Nomurabacteria bacterium]|nr:SdpI family protein [Candidatus Nomurabacteria bacterium]